MIKICYCGKSFNVKPAVLKRGQGISCSRDCNKRKKGGKEIQCLECGKIFYASGWELKRRTGKKFCTKECYQINWKQNVLKRFVEAGQIANTGKIGPLSHSWKGGIYNSIAELRTSSQYKRWRKEVFRRDNWTCVQCGKKGGILNADHIKPFAHFEDLRFELSNGRTLCVPCHKQTPTYGKKAQNIIWQQ